MQYGYAGIMKALIRSFALGTLLARTGCTVALRMPDGSRHDGPLLFAQCCDKLTPR
jgi:hypothetical protein